MKAVPEDTCRLPTPPIRKRLNPNEDQYIHQSHVSHSPGNPSTAKPTSSPASQLSTPSTCTSKSSTLQERLPCQLHIQEHLHPRPVHLHQNQIDCQYHQTDVLGKSLVIICCISSRLEYKIFLIARSISPNTSHVATNLIYRYFLEMKS